MLTPEQRKQELINKLKQAQVPSQNEQIEIPMEPSPMDEMTPEKAKELALEGLRSRGPASVNPTVSDMTEGSDMVAAPLDQFIPAGSYMAEKGMPGQKQSPDVADLSQEPVKQDRLEKLRQMLQNSQR